MNLVPTCDYESEDDDDDCETTAVEEITTENEVENLFKAFEEASIGGEVTDERISNFIASFDQSARDSTGGFSVRNNPRSSEQRFTESQPTIQSPQHQNIFEASFRIPQPLLTSSSRKFVNPLTHSHSSLFVSGLDFFMLQTGFRSPYDIFDRLLQLDQLRSEKQKGNVLMVRFFG
jgi:hypothetical protein